HRPRQPAAGTVDGEGPPGALCEEPSRAIATSRGGPTGRGRARVSALVPALAALARRVHARPRTWAPAPRGLALRPTASPPRGDGWMWLLGGAVVAGAAPRPLGRLASAAAVAAFANLLIVALKTTVRRRRPAAYVPNAFLVATVGAPPDCDRFSFPSGHAANAVALAVVLGHTFPTAGGALLAAPPLLPRSPLLPPHP